ncbi:MAG TPA: hypothetical protein VLJ17_05455 [Xanthobacteraceae bacterium]|nr:hypothetical protein [Xanthobacteraceae bacterium]
MASIDTVSTAGASSTERYRRLCCKRQAILWGKKSSNKTGCYQISPLFIAAIVGQALQAARQEMPGSPGVMPTLHEAATHL